jgi:hypothetical protein
MFPVVHCPVALIFTALWMALSIHRLNVFLWAAAHSWNLIHLNSQRTVMVLAGQLIALRNLRVIASLDVWQVSRTTFFNARRSLSVIKCGLPGHVFFVVVPSRFHFTITSPTIYLGNLRRVTMALTDFLLMWQPITSPRSKALSSTDLPMLLVQLSASVYTSKCGRSGIWASVYCYKGMSQYF